MFDLGVLLCFFTGSQVNKNQSVHIPNLKNEKDKQSEGGLHLSHELFGGEDQLVVDHPARLLLKQGAVGMDINCLLVFYRFISPFT